MKIIKQDYAKLFIIITIFLAGCESKQMTRAKEMMQTQLYQSASTLLRKEIGKNPKNAEANYLLGVCIIEMSGVENAVHFFNSAMLLDTDYRVNVGGIYFDRAISLYKDGDDYGADEYSRKGLNANPSGVDAFAKKLFDYAIAFSDTSSNSQRVRDLFSILDDVSADFKQEITEHSFLLAKYFFDRRLYKEAQNYAEFGIKTSKGRDKEFATLYMGLGNMLLTAKGDRRARGSIEYFKKAIDLDVGKKVEVGNIYHEAAQKFEKNHNINLAILFAEKGAEVNPNSKTLYDLYRDKYKPFFPEGMIAYYPFNGSVHDEIMKNRRTRLAWVTFTTDRFENPNRALSFNGNNSYIIFNANFKDTNEIHGNKNFAISLWVSFTPGASGWQVVYSGRDAFIGFNIGSGIMDVHSIADRDGGRSQYDSKASTTIFYKYSFPIELGGGHAHHVVYIVDSRDMANVYIDNVKVEIGEREDEISRKVVSTGFGQLLSTPSANSYFNGTLDDIRIYSRLLTAPEVAALYHEGGWPQ